MLKKTATQLMLEAQRHKDIEDIMLDVLERYRATPNMVQDCCEDLNVSRGAFYGWAKDFGISITSYHYAATR